jgi:hypothetical protein
MAQASCFSQVKQEYYAQEKLLWENYEIFLPALPHSELILRVKKRID